MSSAVDSAKPRPKVLAIGDDARAFLAVVRSLGRNGIEVHAAPITRAAPALASRYISAIHLLPYYEGDGERWLTASRQLLEREKFDLVIPLDDRSLVPINLHRAAFEGYPFAIPSAAAFEVMFSKARTRELAESLEIPIARGRRSRENETVESILAEFNLPVVLKPLNSFSIANPYQKNVVRKAEGKDQLSVLLSGEFSEGDFLIEANFPGTGLGVSVLASEGNILIAFQHYRVHEPPGGGGSSYRVSAPLRSELLEACRKFTAALRYTGVAMFEFKEEPATRQWILIEVNARFWGSLPLAIAAGVDFPGQLFNLVARASIRPQPPYRLGVYSRSLGDDYWYYRFKLSECRGSWRCFWSLFVATMNELRHVFQGTEHIDTIALDDLRPACREIGGLIGLYSNRLRRAIFRRLSLFRAMQRRRLDRALERYRGSKPPRIVFVCKGNICRSPFAESVLRRLLPEIECISAGTLPQADRAPPPQAVECAEALGFDIAPHRSRIVDDEMLAGPAMIFVFDLENLDNLRANHPAAASRMFLLGSYGSTGGGASCEIVDPFGGQASAYRGSFDRIRDSLEMLVERLKWKELNRCISR